jgi:hypothetical protein
MNLFVIRILKAILSFETSSFVFCLILRACMPKKYARLMKSRICIYSSCFGGYDDFIAPCRQSLPCDNLFFTDKKMLDVCDGLDVIVSSSNYLDPRHDAKYFKLCPHLVSRLANYDFTVWIDASGWIHGRYFLEMLLMCTSGPVSMKAHPDRSSIWSEALYSQKMIKYSSCDLSGQARKYLLQGMADDHLWHCALIVRDSSEASVRFNESWWREMASSLQDQISAPYVEHATGVAIKPIPKLLNLFNCMSYNTSHRNHEYLSR